MTAISKSKTWVQDLTAYTFSKTYDLILCHGVLHLVAKPLAVFPRTLVTTMTSQAMASITNYEKSSQDLNPESLDFIGALNQSRTGDLIHY